MESYQEEVVAETKSRYVVAKEVAEAEFARWAEAMGLMAKFDPELLGEDEVKDLAATKRPVIAAIMEGNLVVDTSGRFVFTPYNVEGPNNLGQITFNEPKMIDLRDATKESNKVDSQVLLMSKMTNKPTVQLIRMKQRNSAVCNAIVGLFLG